MSFPVLILTLTDVNVYTNGFEVPVLELLLVEGGGGGGVLGSVDTESIIFDGACSLIFSGLVFICACTAIATNTTNVANSNNFFMVKYFFKNDKMKIQWLSRKNRIF